MPVSIVLTDSIKDIENKVNKAIADLANKIISRSLGSIISSVKSLIPTWIVAQPEIQSLLSNDPSSLAGQFGIPGNKPMIVNKIIKSVMDATETKFIKYSSNLSGGLELRFQPATFANLLGLPEGHVAYNGTNLHWLDWLLKRGDNIIVVNYQYNPQTGFGRSGLGNMVGGGSFRVPPEFSGTDDNNFITRAFIGQTQEKQISQIIENILSK